MVLVTWILSHLLRYNPVKSVEPLPPLLPSQVCQLLQPVSTGPRLDGQYQQHEVKQEADKEQQPGQDVTDLQSEVQVALGDNSAFKADMQLSKQRFTLLCHRNPCLGFKHSCHLGSQQLRIIRLLHENGIFFSGLTAPLGSGLLRHINLTVG